MEAGLRILIEKDYDAMSERSARLIAAEIRKNPATVLGLPTGDTPVGTYKRLVTLHEEEGLDFSKVKTFNLDEYMGLSADNENSYNRFMWDNLFSRINIDPAHVRIPKGDDPRPDDFCRRYEEEIKAAGGIDLQLLGIGGDGHIGFNEPCSSLGSRTRVVPLAKETIADNTRYFEKKEDVPVFAVTMGVGTIMEARRIILIASGKKKAAVTAQFIEGPVTSMVTASALQFHPSVTVILDEAVASMLRRLDHYRWIMTRKEEQSGK
jgi:glucosamine-6-phosphate deaminase